MKPRIKICCIQSKKEADTAIEYGASALGLVGKMPSGPGPIPDKDISMIAKSVPPPVATFLLTSEITGQAIASHHARTLTNTLQVVDIPRDGTHRFLKNKIPYIKLVQVIHVTDESSLDDASRFFTEVDALLLDSGNPTLEVKELGGTGRTHNWNISRKIVDQSPVPVFLAGGLTSNNVKHALDIVQPYGLDICSGIRTNGRLDRQKLEDFMKAVGV